MPADPARLRDLGLDDQYSEVPHERVQAAWPYDDFEAEVERILKALRSTHPAPPAQISPCCSATSSPMFPRPPMASSPGTFLIHPGLLLPNCLQSALESRVAQFLRMPEGFLPLGGDPLAHRTLPGPGRRPSPPGGAYLALCVIRGQAARDCPLEPLDGAALPALADALLRAQTGSLS